MLKYSSSTNKLFLKYLGISNDECGIWIIYLFRLAVEGYNRLLQQGHFTKSKTSENAFVQYRINNDILYQWLVEKNYKIDYLKNKPISDIYGEYSFFMEDKH